jgi:hypothetical protein
MFAVAPIKAMISESKIPIEPMTTLPDSFALDPFAFVKCLYKNRLLSL